MELIEGKKYFYRPLHKPCYIANITTPAGGVSGDKNMTVTVEFTDGTGEAGDVRTFPVGMAERLLSVLRQPMRVEDTDVEETTGDEDEKASL